MLTTTWKKNDKKANWLILTFSVIVFLVVAALGRIQLKVNPRFDVHIFALINAVINSTVTVLLLWALAAVKSGKYQLHKKIMLVAMVLSILFLVSYICHHLLAGDTKFGGADALKAVYYIILFTHIPLAGIILPFILFTAYRGLTGEYPRHKKIARITWPLWLYVAVTGVLVYVMISPYY
ncbi:MAG: DUF420 domain-containing protein [Niabella sp.]